MKSAEQIAVALLKEAKEIRDGGQDLPGFEEGKWGKLVLLLEEASVTIRELHRTTRIFDTHMIEQQKVIAKLDDKIEQLTHALEMEKRK